MSSRPVRIALLGSTGSIGTSTVRIVRECPDRFQLSVIAAGSNVEKLAEQAREFHPHYAVVHDPAKYQELKNLLPAGTEALAGPEALCQLMHSEEIDLVLTAIVGTGGLQPTLEAIKAGKKIALASKEVMVMAGEIVTRTAEKYGVRILPVDSEHNAIFQCLEGRDPDDVKDLILTASGGPFRKFTKEQIRAATWQDALKHPTWSMGPKVTIDCASLMNKALEMIEARWLFNTPEHKIQVLIHPQSIVHSMVRFNDGGILAQMNVPDMRFPILYTLTWPHRGNANLPPLDLAACGALTFEHPDEDKFPSLEYARIALRQGGVMPAVLNAANEVAYARFRDGGIAFPHIWQIVESTMSAMEPGNPETLDEIYAADARARAIAREWRPAGRNS